MSGITGDIGALARLKAKLLRLPGLSDRVAADVAPDISGVAVADFAAHRSPAGAAWPARAQRHGLVGRTGNLRAAVTRYSASGGSRLTTGSMPRYARYQNPRIFLPPQRKLPQSYIAAIDVAFARTIDRLLAGGA